MPTLTIAKTTANHIKINQDSNVTSLYNVYSPIKILPLYSIPDNISEQAGVTGTAANWTLATNATNLNVGGYTHTTGAVTALTFSLNAVKDTYYQVVVTITGRTGGNVTVTFGGATVSGAAITASTISTIYATATTALSITPTTDFDGTVVISLKATSALSSIIFTLGVDSYQLNFKSFSSITVTSTAYTDISTLYTNLISLLG